MEQDYKLQGLKAEDAMSLLLRCCPDAHAAIRMPLKVRNSIVLHPGVAFVHIHAHAVHAC